MQDLSEEERFMRLEVKSAYLEKLTEDLNDVVIAQGKLIDDLSARLERLERQQRAGEDDQAIPHEKPPHY
jgi:uncharacterized coiled-coil protein SlyX